MASVNSSDLQSKNFHDRADDNDQAKTVRRISVEEDRNVMYVPARFTPVEIESRLSFRGSIYQEPRL